MTPAASSREDPATGDGRRQPLGRFTCVVDDQPRFHLDALRWFTSLTAVAGVDPSDLVVHVVGNESTDVLDYLRGRGVTVRPVERFDPRSPHCNKISGALRLADEGPEGMVVLCDTDVVIIEDPRPIEIPAGAIAGKLVDAPVPPFDVILDIFGAAGVAAPPPVPLPWGSDQRTVTGNSNGGLYLIPGSLLPQVTAAWAQWARWLLDRAELLRQWTVYIDQVAMALALAATDLGCASLDVRWNTPVHDPSRIPADAAPPSVIHYHQQVDDRGMLLPTGVPSIDLRIGMVNNAIGTLWPDGFPASTFREWHTLRTQALSSDRGNASTDSTTKAQIGSVLDRGRRFLSKYKRGPG